MTETTSINGRVSADALAADAGGAFRPQRRVSVLPD